MIERMILYLNFEERIIVRRVYFCIIEGKKKEDKKKKVK